MISNTRIDMQALISESFFLEQRNQSLNRDWFTDNNIY